VTPQAFAQRWLDGSMARPLALLESPGPAKAERLTLLAGEPLFVLEAFGRRTRLRCGAHSHRLSLPPAGAWRALEGALKSRPGGFLWPWVGAFSYEAGGQFERLPAPKPEPMGLPDWWGFLPGLWAWRQAGAWRLGCAGLDGATARRLARAWGLPPRALQAACLAPREALARARGWLARPGRLKAPAAAEPLRGLQDSLGAAGYQARVRRIRRHILDGDLYQANLAHQLSAPYAGRAFDLYRRLCALNPSPMAAFVDLGPAQVVSASPERLFKMGRRRVETWPIAGTAPRRGRPGERSALRADAKNAAEHVMLVDLERNDLGRVCEPGSVTVPRFRVIETYAHLHHLVSQVRGRLKPGLGLLDLLAAGFPGGSITGAPKLRCMQAIHALEPQARGWYTGSLGWWDPKHGRADLNILIRTVFLKAGRAYASAGAGIVLDSDPRAEWDETLVKARALLRALGKA
jgi:anthranilate/para-aminobenzoate synthase component I